MARQEFDKLLESMPEIADVVNSFHSETVQKEAFTSLLSAFWGNSTMSTGPGDTSTHDEERATVEAGGETDASPSKRSAGRRKKERYEPKFIRDLDLTPPDKKSFRDFIDEKRPKTNEEKYVVTVYYLQYELGLNAVTLDHVASVFRLTPGWKEPANIRSGITTTSSRKGTIDTASFSDLKTTPHGRNFVEFQLPHKGKK